MRVLTYHFIHPTIFRNILLQQFNLNTQLKRRQNYQQAMNSGILLQKQTPLPQKLQHTRLKIIPDWSLEQLKHKTERMESICFCHLNLFSYFFLSFQCKYSPRPKINLRSSFKTLIFLNKLKFSSRKYNSREFLGMQ